MPTATIGRGLPHIRAELARLRNSDFALTDYETQVQDTMLRALASMRGVEGDTYNPKVTWRLRMLLHAAGAETIDGSDLPAADFALLLLLDHYISHREKIAGPESAERALYNVVRILEAEDEPAIQTEH